MNFLWNILYSGKFSWGPYFVLFVLSLSERIFNTPNVCYDGCVFLCKIDRTKIKHMDQLEIAQKNFGPHENSRYTVISPLLKCFLHMSVCSFHCNNLGQRSSHSWLWSLQRTISLLQGFKYFATHLRGREEMICSIINEPSVSWKSFTQIVSLWP